MIVYNDAPADLRRIISELQFNELRAKGYAIVTSYADQLHGIKVGDVLRATAEVSGLSVADLKGRITTFRYTRPRQAAMYTAHCLTDQTYPAIGRVFERDHSTIMNGCEAVKARLVEGDLETAELLENIRRALPGVIATRLEDVPNV